MAFHTVLKKTSNKKNARGKQVYILAKGAERIFEFKANKISGCKRPIFLCTQIQAV